jgi:hypothetical protein
MPRKLSRTADPPQVLGGRVADEVRQVNRGDVRYSDEWSDKMKMIRLLVISFFALGALVGCQHVGNAARDGDATDTDADTDSDTDIDIDTDSDMDTDTDTGTDTNAVACVAAGNWYDPATGLCWQDPPPVLFPSWDEAVAYCEEWAYEGWRLPTIQELISLLRGCVDGVATGDLSTSECGVTDPGCLGDECNDSGCGICAPNEGPDDDTAGCYWDPGLSMDGPCSSYWSSSPYTGIGSGGWIVLFFNGLVTNSAGGNNVRCVRGGV